MSSELTYMEHPWRSRLAWAAVYVVLALVVLVGSYIYLNRIRTYSVPNGQVELRVLHTRYLLGEPISFTLKNSFNSPIYAVNRCPQEPLGVYKYVNTSWVRIHANADKDCTTQDRKVTIPANSAITVSLAPWQALFSEAGKYRLVVFVEYYNALPYQDIEVVTKPQPKIVTLPPDTKTSTSGSTSGQITAQDLPQPQPQPEPESRTPVNYTVHVTSNGTYDNTSLSLLAGDTLTLVYNPPVGDEVRTRFTAQNGSPAVASVTLDHDVKSRTITFSTTGTWTFRADDHNSNTGTITVQ